MFFVIDDFDCDYVDYVLKGVIFVCELQVMFYGKVVVFFDIYGNFWDLVQFVDGYLLVVFGG